MNYLIFASPAQAADRSAAAWQALGAPAGATQFLWAWHVHPTDGRAALAIPATPRAVQIDIPQERYERLLGEEERAALTATRPGEGWDGDD
ncbi:hypothetical protein [Ancylobacter sp. IITR112]|uniref:hypothetical protein n=1 Tax=Ancylobacter sp. IITR112 TaxID=3138073 RepID=UPI00352B7548